MIIIIIAFLSVKNKKVFFLRPGNNEIQLTFIFLLIEGQFNL